MGQPTRKARTETLKSCRHMVHYTDNITAFCAERKTMMKGSRSLASQDF